MKCGVLGLGLTPNIKLTAFKQNAALEVAVNICLTDALTKILNCLLHHYQDVKAQSKNNAIRIEKEIKKQIEESVQTLPSHIKDTNEFVKLIEGTTVPTDCLLVSIDVSSLYTNIPHQEGKQAAMDYLSTNTSDPEPEVIGDQLCWKITFLNSMKNTIYRYKVLLWAPKWPQHTQICLWAR